MSASNQAQIFAFMGASGSGKSSAIKQAIARSKPARLLIWDLQGEYAHAGEAVGKLEVLRAKLATGGARGRFALVFTPASSPDTIRRQFDLFCQLAYCAGNLTLIAEELFDVTLPSWAPAGWSMVTRKGRHRGLKVYGVSQRPAAIDKHFFGNASVIRCGRLNFEADVRTMANVLGVAAEEIRALLALAWIERDMRSGQSRRGTVKF
jgi:hypothetical protein